MSFVPNGGVRYSPVLPGRESECMLVLFVYHHDALPLNAKEPAIAS